MSQDTSLNSIRFKVLLLADFSDVGKFAKALENALQMKGAVQTVSNIGELQTAIIKNIKEDSNLCQIIVSNKENELEANAFIYILKRWSEAKIGLVPLTGRRSLATDGLWGWSPLKGLIESICDSIREVALELISSELSTGAFTMKVLTGEAELLESFRLRYSVYESMNYLKEKNRSEMDIDEFDRFSIPLGVFENRTGALVGYVRIVTTEVQSFYANKIKQIIDRICEEGLQKTFIEEPQLPFPSLAGYSREHNLPEALDRFNRKKERVCELSRYIVAPGYRGSSVWKILAEFAVAFALHLGMPIGVAAGNPKAMRLYAKFGYRRYPGIDLIYNEKVGEMSCPLVADFTDFDKMASASRGVVRWISEELSRGAHAFVVDAGARSDMETTLPLDTQAVA